MQSLRDFFSRPSFCVAPDLVGAAFRVNGVGGMVVEVEAYEPYDAASHSFRGPTPRCRAMFGQPATAYVYRSHGLHWCLNFVCLPGSAVLIRALEPVWDIETMAGRRGMTGVGNLCSGPGKLSQALGIDGSLDGASLDMPPFTLSLAPKPAAVLSGRRVGISKDVERPWRFVLSGSRFISRRIEPAGLQLTPAEA